MPWSYLIALVQIAVAVLAILTDDHFATAIERLQLDYAVIDQPKHGSKCCREYPWTDTKGEQVPGQCLSPISIARDSVEVDNDTTVTFVNYHKRIPTNVKAMYGRPDVGEKGEQTVTGAIFADPSQDLHVIVRAPNAADAIYNFHFINIHMNCAEHKLEDRSKASIILEAQFVHYNRKFTNMEEAMRGENGVYIYSIAFEQRLLFHMSRYSHALKIYLSIFSPDHLTAGLTDEISSIEARSWTDLFPLESPSYVYKYEGTMVQPPCQHSVTWNIDYADKSYNGTVVAANLTSEKYAMPGLANLFHFERLRGCAFCALPTCRKTQPPPSDTKIQQIRLIISTKGTTRMGKIVAAVLTLLIIIVGICITVVFKYILIAAFLVVLGIIVLTLFGFIT